MGLLLVTGCGASYSALERTVRAGAVRFRVGALPGAWARARLRGARVVFHHEDGGSISAGADCHPVDDVPLEVLTNHLLFGFAPRTILSQERLTIDGRAALRSAVRAVLDGVPVALELLVVKKDGCLFDLQLVGAPSRMAALAPDFAAFWGGFARLEHR